MKTSTLNTILAACAIAACATYVANSVPWHKLTLRGSLAWLKPVKETPPCRPNGECPELDAFFAAREKAMPPLPPGFVLDEPPAQGDARK